MTFCYANLSDGRGFIISDLMLTRDIEANSEHESFLFPGNKILTDGHKLAGLCRKYVPIDLNTGFFFAGSPLLARIAQKNFRSIGKKWTDFSNIKSIVFDGLEEDDLSLLIFIMNGKKSRVFTHNVDYYSSEGAAVFAIGSGSLLADESYRNQWMDAPVEISLIHGGVDAAVNIGNPFLRITELILHDLFVDGFEYFRSGVWYELYIPSGEKIIEVPYGCTFWRRVSDVKYEIVNHFFSNYYDNNIYVLRLDVDGFANKESSGLVFAIAGSVGASYKIRNIDIKLGDISNPSCNINIIIDDNGKVLGNYFSSIRLF